MFLLDEGFSTKQWWAVDLKAICRIHLVRVVTDVDYKGKGLENLGIYLGEVATPETTS